MTAPFYFLPVGLQQYQQSTISMGRILDFLSRDDLTPYVDSGRGDDDDDVSIELRDACMSWSPEQDEAAPGHVPVAVSGGSAYAAASVADDEAKADCSDRGAHTLRNLSLKIKHGQLVAIVGPVEVKCAVDAAGGDGPEERNRLGPPSARLPLSRADHRLCRPATVDRECNRGGEPHLWVAAGRGSPSTRHRRGVHAGRPEASERGFAD